MNNTQRPQISVFYLIYISTSTKQMEERDLRFLLEQSRRNNSILNITGMLLYMEGHFINMNEVEGRFIQMLEGDESDVRKIYNLIQLDERNQDVLVLNTGYSNSRNFKGWSMGFEKMNQEVYRSTPGFFELEDRFLKTDAFQKSSLPLNYLKSFYRQNKDTSDKL
jgi:hypothetical protein